MNLLTKSIHSSRPILNQASLWKRALIFLRGRKALFLEAKKESIPYHQTGIAESSYESLESMKAGLNQGIQTKKRVDEMLANLSKDWLNRL